MNDTFETYARNQFLTVDEVVEMLAFHGQYLGDWLMDQGIACVDDMPEETDGNVLADWLGY